MSNYAEIDGKLIEDEKGFYVSLIEQIDMGDYFGKNLDALYDSLSRNVERPVHIRWKNHELSEKKLGKLFLIIKDIMSDISKEDEETYPEGKRFTFSLD